MKIRTFALIVFCLYLNASLHAQTALSPDFTRIAVYGNATVEVDADVIVCYLNMYDNGVNYDYTEPYNAKKVLNEQIVMLDRLGCKIYMTNPTYAQLGTYTGVGPYELRFNSQAEYESMQQRVQLNATETYSVTLEYAYSDISVAKRKTSEMDAIGLAIADAKLKADAMARNLGVSVGMPLLVEESDQAAVYNYEGAGGYFGEVGVGSKVKVNAKVRVEYQSKK